MELDTNLFQRNLRLKEGKQPPKELDAIFNYLMLQTVDDFYDMYVENEMPEGQEALCKAVFEAFEEVHD